MPILHGSGGNVNRAPTPDSLLDDTQVQSCTPDPTYYYHDGNIVLLVGDVLFKLHRSILLSRMMEEPDDLPKIMRSDIELNGNGTSDDDPVIIQGADAEQFRRFLFLLLGTPADPDYLSFFTGANDIRNHTKDTFLSYLGVAILAQYFGMSELESWSRTQLKLVLKSATRFANSSWNKNILLQAMGYADTHLRLYCEMHAFVQLALSVSVPKKPLKYQSPLSSNLDTCVALYKDPEVPTAHPVLFGYVFTVVLSLGPHSSIWINQLTREDRILLYTAHAHLVSLRNDPGLQLAWLSQRSRTRVSVCTSCTKHIDTAWNATFTGCGSLDSAVPLEDISKLVLLPSYRRLFADLTRSNPKPCEHECIKVVLSDIDYGIDEVWHGMYRKYRHYAENS